MRVLLAAAQFSSNISGLQRHALNVVRCLLAQPEIEEIQFVYASWQTQMFQDAGLDAIGRVRPHIATMNDGMLSRNLWYYRQLPKLVTRMQPDVVHLTYPVPMNAAAINRPIVLTLHDLYPYEIPDNFGYPKVLFHRAILQQSLRGADAIACVSETTMQRMQQHTTRSCWKKALKIQNCVEATSECSSCSPIPRWSGEPYLLCVAQHRKNKNIPLLIRVFHRLLREYRVRWDTRLVVVGIEGPETPRIHRLVSELHLEHRVTFLQGLSESQLQWCYRNSEALAAPSEAEGFGLPVAEALLAGCRVVCSDIPAFREIDEAHCQFAELGDNKEEKLAAAIVSCLQRPAPAPVALPQLSPDVVGAAYVRLYRRLLSSELALQQADLSRPSQRSADKTRTDDVLRRVPLTEEREGA